MNPKKADTPARIARRKYEEKRKEERKQANSNFQTMIPRGEYEEITAYLNEKGITKVELIRKGYEALKALDSKERTKEKYANK